jgi:hypothetical protein
MSTWNSVLSRAESVLDRWSVRGGIALAVTASALAPGVASASSQSAAAAPPTMKSNAARSVAAALPQGTTIQDVVRQAKPFKIDTDKGLAGRSQAGGPRAAAQGADGPAVSVAGALGRLTPSKGALRSAGAATSLVQSAAAAAQNGPWPYSYDTNPNRQIGKLYFDVDPGAGTRWSWCSATVVNSENKSMVLTAGHCVYSPDPDGDGRITGNGFWHQSPIFCPGYESGCRLGSYTSRLQTTTRSWFSGTGGGYDWGDDIGIVLVQPNGNGQIVPYTGAQGVRFNATASRFVWAFGYPASDSRWPEYTYSGEDMIYCPGTTNVVDANHLSLSCTMTGGASGGPWLTDVDYNSWLGYVNSVNSHKPWGGASMGGPYFGNAELNLYNYARAL